MNRLDIARKEIVNMGRISALDNYFLLSCLGGLMILTSVGVYGSNQWIRYLDPDSLAPKDVGDLFWMFGAGVILLILSVLAFRRIRDARAAFFKRMHKLNLNELLELCLDKEFKEWARWILHRRIRELGTGHREYIASVHLDDGVKVVYDELDAVKTSIDQLAALFAQADRMKKANPLPWTLRLTYLVPILTLIWVGWAASWIWMYPEWIRMSLMVVMFFGIYFPLVLIGVVARRRVGTIEEEVKRVLSAVPTWALVRFSGARLFGASLELMRRSRAKDLEAKRGLRVAERVRTKTQKSHF